MTLKEEILELVGAEQILGIVLGSGEGIPNETDQPQGVVLTWAQACRWIDYERENEFGDHAGNAFCLWTPTRVLFMHDYDGLRWPTSVPRNPVAGVVRAVGDQR